MRNIVKKLSIKYFNSNWHITQLESMTILPEDHPLYKMLQSDGAVEVQDEEILKLFQLNEKFDYEVIVKFNFVMETIHSAAGLDVTIVPNGVQLIDIYSKTRSEG